MLDRGLTRCEGDTHGRWAWIGWTVRQGGLDLAREALILGMLPRNQVLQFLESPSVDRSTQVLRGFWETLHRQGIDKQTDKWEIRSHLPVCDADIRANHHTENLHVNQTCWLEVPEWIVLPR